MFLSDLHRFERRPKPARLADSQVFRRHFAAVFAEPNEIKRDGIAVRQLRALREHQTADVL
jgi:hypothetical protein